MIRDSRYRVAFIRKTSNTKSSADQVIQMVPADSETGAEINQVFLRETEKKKYRPGTIVRQMKTRGLSCLALGNTPIYGRTKMRKTQGTSLAPTWRDTGFGMKPGLLRSESIALKTRSYTSHRRYDLQSVQLRWQACPTSRMGSR